MVDECARRDGDWVRRVQSVVRGVWSVVRGPWSRIVAHGGMEAGLICVHGTLIL